MGLLETTTAFQYYNKTKLFQGSEGSEVNSIPRSKFIFPDGFLYKPKKISDFTVKLNNQVQGSDNYTFSIANGIVSITFVKKTVDYITSNLSSTVTLANEDVITISLHNDVVGNYRYVSLKDLVSNFMVGYVGDGKLVNSVKRSEVLFHAKRILQEFNYDINRIEKIQEIEVPPSLSIPMPQDYVNYVRLSWFDNGGIEHIIYPSRLTSKPSQSILQDSDYEYLFTDENLLTGEPQISENFKDFDLHNVSGALNSNDYFYNQTYHTDKVANTGLRYGLDPEVSQHNGVFVIDELNGKISFSSDLKDRSITFKYLSDGLATDDEMKIHKFAEEGMYKSLVFNILSTRAGVPEFIINRYRKERRAAMRNAKIRLSNFKLSEISQVMRGKSKQIKH